MRGKTLRKNLINKAAWTIGFILLSSILAGCQSVKPAKAIIGSWNGQLHGFPVVVEYTETTVGVGNVMPVTYSIDGDLITLANENSERYRVEFPAKNEMLQINEMTGTTQQFTRRTESGN